MVYDGRYIFELMSRFTMTDETSNSRQTAVNPFSQGLTLANYEEYLDIGRIALEDLSTMTGNTGALRMWLTLVETAFRLRRKEGSDPDIIWEDNEVNHYRVYVHLETHDGTTLVWLSLWCLDPSIAFAELSRQRPHSYILTSGTLTPIASYESELRINFAVKLENRHMIDADRQLLPAIIRRGPTGRILNCSYQNRAEESLLIELGNALVSFAKVVPGGLLVFFPSYSPCTLR
eukprot:TRINITY_DN19992_c0_g1_i2.p1 TRINITY_DN19992_c0_g1~~TRINITY_DN19992_c0_g1_i2.p1  ORF type:complete len:233 (+),score=36.50 TRINITY_DN19992_c0_g1_i2:196-894(+)